MRENTKLKADRKPKETSKAKMKEMKDEKNVTVEMVIIDEDSNIDNENSKFKEAPPQNS